MSRNGRVARDFVAQEKNRRRYIRMATGVISRRQRATGHNPSDYHALVLSPEVDCLNKIQTLTTSSARVPRQSS